MNYSNEPSMVRVDFWKPSGKWYTTEAIKWIGYDGEIFMEFARSLRAHLGERMPDMTVTCLSPYNHNAHPICIKDGRWICQEMLL